MKESKIWYFMTLISLTNFIVWYFYGVNYILVLYFIITIIITQYLAIYHPKKTVINWLSNIDKNDNTLKLETINHNIKKKLKNMDINELKKHFLKKIRKNVCYHKKLKEDVFILKYPKYGTKLLIKNYLVFNKAYIVLNLTQKESCFLTKELETYNIQDSYVFIMNIYIKSSVVIENDDINCLISNQYEDSKNNKINFLNFWVHLNNETTQYISPIFKIYLKSQYISYETMSYLKRKGDPIEYINDDNKEFIYSRTEGIDKLIKYLFGSLS